MGFVERSKRKIQVSRHDKLGGQQTEDSKWHSTTGFQGDEFRLQSAATDEMGKYDKH